jgi:hypothetical protein
VEVTAFFYLFLKDKDEGLASNSNGRTEGTARAYFSGTPHPPDPPEASKVLFFQVSIYVYIYIYIYIATNMSLVLANIRNPSTRLIFNWLFFFNALCLYVLQSPEQLSACEACSSC